MQTWDVKLNIGPVNGFSEIDRTTYLIVAGDTPIQALEAILFNLTNATVFDHIKEINITANKDKA